MILLLLYQMHLFVYQKYCFKLLINLTTKIPILIIRATLFQLIVKKRKRDNKNNIKQSSFPQLTFYF